MTRTHRSLSAAAPTLATLLTLVSGCAEDASTPSQFLGEHVVLAADEPGSILYSPGSRTADLSIAVLSGEATTEFGWRLVDDVFGAMSLLAVLVEGAPAGSEATLELRERDEPIDEITVEFVDEGDIALREAPPTGRGTASGDPLGALCILERSTVGTLVARRAADGRWLDASFPSGSEVRVGVQGTTPAPVVTYGGSWIANFTAPAAGTFALTVTSGSGASEREWGGVVRVVRADEIVALDVMTPTEDNIMPTTLVAVLRTADGCPVIGARLTLVVDGVALDWQSGWRSAFGSAISQGLPLSVRWNDFVEDAVF